MGHWNLLDSCLLLFILNSLPNGFDVPVIRLSLLSQLCLRIANMATFDLFSFFFYSCFTALQAVFSAFQNPRSGHGVQPSAADTKQLAEQPRAADSSAVKELRLQLLPE